MTVRRRIRILDNRASLTLYSSGAVQQVTKYLYASNVYCHPLFKLGLDSLHSFGVSYCRDPSARITAAKGSAPTLLTHCLGWLILFVSTALKQSGATSTSHLGSIAAA